jgi:hypothetical protein
MFSCDEQRRLIFFHRIGPFAREGRFSRVAAFLYSQDPKQTWSVGSYLGPLLASLFLISGLSYKTTFSSELRISSVPLYSI